jgi:tRNA A37 threonylcarbamoyladenosine dehydratase
MSDKSQIKDAKQEKADRLAQALRENLRKRKAQGRLRKTADKAPSPHNITSSSDSDKT